MNSAEDVAAFDYRYNSRVALRRWYVTSLWDFDNFTKGQLRTDEIFFRRLKNQARAKGKEIHTNKGFRSAARRQRLAG